MKTRTLTNQLTVLAIAIIGLVAFSAHAALIQPVGVTASTELSSWAAVGTINGDGLNAPQDETATHSPSTSGNSWLCDTSESGIGAEITFDLGSEQDLSGAWIWNFNQDGQQGRGFIDYDIYVGDSSDPTATTLLGSYTISRYPDGSGTAYGPEFEAFSASGAQHVRFVSQSTGNNDIIGLSEVRFESGVIPEPSTAILACLGLLGLSLRRRRRK